MRRLSFLVVALAALGLTACTSGPVDAAGNYTVSVTNRDNGCNLQNWTVGQMSTNIGVTVTQDGDTAAATVNGITGGILTLGLGSNVFSGTVDGDMLHLTLYGSRSQTSGNCTYTYNAVLGATVDGDIIQGSIDYVAKGNGNPDCATISNCHSTQDFNGTRPPS